MPSRFASILRPELADLAAYEPAPDPPVDRILRLDANESPPLLSLEARRALAAAMEPDRYSRYPDARMKELRAAIAARCDADPDEVLVGVGSDEVIALLLTALDRPRDRPTGSRKPADPPTILTTSPTFVMYRLSARTRGFRVVEVPLDASWDLDVSAMKRAIDFGQPNVIFIATPNNPTSNLMSRDRLEAVIEAAPDALVVVDEAYIDFAPRAQLDLMRRYPNVGILRTISKVGFAALRLGWFLGPAELVREVDKVRQPYNVPTPTQRGATLVFRELGGEIARMTRLVCDERKRLAQGLVDLGFDVTPSDANFLWVSTKRPAIEIVKTLRERGVLIKSFHAAGGRLANRIRITVGLPEEDDVLLAEIARCA